MHWNTHLGYSKVHGPAGKQFHTFFQFCRTRKNIIQSNVIIHCQVHQRDIIEVGGNSSGALNAV